ncbi:hypothetical protein R4K92_10935 [Brachyspira intermedia]|uniref:hypothetical protein n=1 Tax=Brachyspira intermedia TaxID=84377 RepID=UPI003005CA34
MDIFEIICNAVDNFDDGFENVLESLNEKIEGSENKSRRSSYKNNTDVRNNKRNTARRKNNNLENNSILIDVDKEIKKEIEYNTYKLKENINNLKYKVDLKFNEIKELIKDFDYASKKSYEESCTELQNNFKDELKKIDNIKNDEDYKNYIESINKIICYINNLYKSAYYKKNNKSSLAFLIDDEDEQLELIEYLN